MAILKPDVLVSSRQRAAAAAAAAAANRQSAQLMASKLNGDSGGAASFQNGNGTPGVPVNLGVSGPGSGTDTLINQAFQSPQSVASNENGGMNHMMPQPQQNHINASHQFMDKSPDVIPHLNNGTVYQNNFL